MKRLAILVAFATVALGVLPASPAGASPASDTGRLSVGDEETMSDEDCENYLEGQGYDVGPKVADACNSGAIHQTRKCVQKLIAIEVKKRHAAEACQRADVETSAS